MVGRWNVLAKWCLFNFSGDIRHTFVHFSGRYTFDTRYHRAYLAAGRWDDWCVAPRTHEACGGSRIPVSQEVAVWMSRGSSINPSLRKKYMYIYIVYSRNWFFWVYNILLPFLKLTVRTWKWMFGRRSFPFGKAHPGGCELLVFQDSHEPLKKKPPKPWGLGISATWRITS